jgi:hypothetical protein
MFAGRGGTVMAADTVTEHMRMINPGCRHPSCDAMAALADLR